jgi:hypothetical protein
VASQQPLSESNELLGLKTSLIATIIENFASLYRDMVTSLNHRLYPPPQPPAGPGQNVPVHAGVVLLDSGNEGGLFGMGTSIGACFKEALGPKVY